MKTTSGNRIIVTVGALWLAASLPLSATTIYDNTATNLNTRFNPSTTEVGDQILLFSSAASYLTNFSFEYWGTNSLKPDNSAFAGTVQARVRFYLNNGSLFNGYSAPGTNIYDSGWFGGFSPAKAATLVFTPGADNIPVGGLLLPAVGTLTWSVQFNGMAASDQVGVDLYSLPVVGKNYPDYWENDAGIWTLKTNSLVSAMDFGARLQAAVPEPTTLVLGAVGGLLLLAGARRANRKP